MQRSFFKLLLVALIVTVVPVSVWADIPMGFVSWDVPAPGSVGQFDIVNETGVNSTGDATFPVTTTVTFSNLSLLVDFSDGSSQTFGPGSGYFSLALDGQSFDGSPIAIGGANPIPTEAILTGTFSPTTVTEFDSSVHTIDSSFTATILPSTGLTLADGDFAIINATETTGAAVPEPGMAGLLGAGLASLIAMRSLRGKAKQLFRSAKGPGILTAALLLCCLMLLPSTSSAAVKLNAATSPSSGTAGVDNVNIIGSGFPTGTITPANVVTTWAGSCGGAVVATDLTANSVKTIIGSVRRINLNIPGALATGTYFVQVSDSAPGDADFTTAAGSCSEIQVTHTNKALAACVPTSSLGVNAPVTGPAAVTAYVPNGCWECSNTGVQAVPLEPTPVAAPSAIATPHVVNSCSANPVTGEIVCTANNTDVYLISGTTLNNTLTSSSDITANFSGGSCNNCGVAIDALNNKAWIAEGTSAGTSGSGIQALDLATNVFGTVQPSINKVSEDISIDPTRGFILSASEELRSYDLFQYSGTTATDNQNQLSSVNEMDSSAEDCSTGIALASDEFTSRVVLADLTQAIFTPGSVGPPATPNTWTAGAANAAEQEVTLMCGPSPCSFAAGTTGISVAQGSSHLAVVTGEFGGNSFAILQLPSTSGSGTPALVDYAYVSSLPLEPSGGTFFAGLDPHTVTAYVSPNDGKAYALMASGPSSSVNCLARIDMAAILAAPRTAGTNTVSAVPAGAVTFIWTGNGANCSVPPPI